MKDYKLLSKEELIKLCRSEKVTDDTIYLFHECALNSVPAASSYVGEWIWSNDAYKLFICYNECILWNFLAELNHYNEDVTEDKNLIDLINIYIKNNKFSDDIKKLKIMIESTISIYTYEELSIYVFCTTNLLKNLNLGCDTYICNDFDKVLDQVEIHNEGIIPVFDTKEEYLIEDGYC